MTAEPMMLRMEQRTDNDRRRWMLARADYHQRLAEQLRRLVDLLDHDEPSTTGPEQASAIRRQ
jgi:hypothetical protein